MGKGQQPEKKKPAKRSNKLGSVTKDETGKPVLCRNNPGTRACQHKQKIGWEPCRFCQFKDKEE